MNQTDRSLQLLQEEIEGMRATVEDVRKSTYVLVRITFILLVSIIVGLIWG
jgi:hypothetical protein